MKSILITVVVIFINLTCSAQNYIYKGNQRYESTSSWDFDLNSGIGSLEVRIGKHSNGGYLMLSKSEFDPSMYIGGTVTVFLSDGSIIKCIDRGIRDRVDEKSIALYNFTKDEIKKLKELRIVTIRFSIIGPMGKESYTADNKRRTYFYDPSSQSSSETEYKTEEEISELFG